MSLCDVHKVKIACHAAAAAGSLIESNFAHAVANGVQVAWLLDPESVEMMLIACIGSALIWGLERRYLATVGYLSYAAGWDTFAAAMLAFHHGLMAFDAEDVHAPVAISNAGLALAFSAENFQSEDK